MTCVCVPAINFILTNVALHGAHFRPLSSAIPRLLLDALNDVLLAGLVLINDLALLVELPFTDFKLRKNNIIMSFKIMLRRDGTLKNFGLEGLKRAEFTHYVYISFILPELARL